MKIRRRTFAVEANEVTQVSRNKTARPDKVRKDGVELSEAAEILGTTPEAVRKRINRGKLKGYKVDGRWYVILPSGQNLDNDRTEVDIIGEFKSENQTGKGKTSPDNGPDGVRTDVDLVQSLKEEVDFLRKELESRREEIAAHAEEIRRKDHIIAGLMQRIPELPSQIGENVADEKMQEIAVTLERWEQRDKEREEKLLQALKLFEEFKQQIAELENTERPKKRWWPWGG